MNLKIVLIAVLLVFSACSRVTMSTSGIAGPFIDSSNKNKEIKQ